MHRSTAVGHGGEQPHLQIDPLQSVPGFELTLPRRHPLRSEPTYTKTDRKDHLPLSMIRCIILPTSSETGKSE
ncbi:hypothetical protein pdam_00009643 [Pocillopora damicornis]|uniref:Uncharacterized protein n=1 Tax=Pocillopora damicornis TaxID=46731 RepID=A0A3M6UAB6_POCDA|nr:hypothetical protein pdam_00009643 [Pocillopora damicornis]